MLRGLRWGELRGSSDPGVLEAPPSDLRQQIKALAMRNRWAELLELAEQIMALPCSRAWLDLQRFVVEACTALGDKYNAIAVAIRSELRTLLRDLPQLLDAALTDDTPAANSETQRWLRELLAEPSDAPPLPGAPHGPAADDARAPGWQKRFVDPQALAQEAMRAGQQPKAVEILQREVERALSGRARFLRKMQLARICIAAGKDSIAQPLLDDVAAAIDTHKLDDWEDRETIARRPGFPAAEQQEDPGGRKSQAGAVRADLPAGSRPGALGINHAPTRSRCGGHFVGVRSADRRRPAESRAKRPSRAHSPSGRFATPCGAISNGSSIPGKWPFHPPKACASSTARSMSTACRTSPDTTWGPPPPRPS